MATTGPDNALGAGEESLLDEALLAGLGSLAPHQRLGRYELLVPVGRGGMAVVWAARRDGSRALSQMVAVKTMLPALGADPYFERMFLAEARLAARVKHPNVCGVIDHGEERGLLYLVMEWVEGESLAMVSRAGRLPFGVAARIALDAARGLHAAHELGGDDGRPLGIVHRDVSPENILVGFDGESKIADFGVAKATSEGGERTRAGYQKGKTRYMSPEQVYCEDVDRRTDIFALGIVLYEVTTGVHPFSGPTPMAILAKIGDGEAVKSPRALVADYPEALARVVARCLAKAPEERYATMDQVAQDLALALESLPCGTPEDVASFALTAAGERASRRGAALREAVRPGRADVGAPAVGPGRAHRSRTLAASAAVAIVAVGVGALWLARSDARSSAVPAVGEGASAMARDEPPGEARLAARSPPAGSDDPRPSRGPQDPGVAAGAPYAAGPERSDSIVPGTPSAASSASARAPRPLAVLPALTLPLPSAGAATRPSPPRSTAAPSRQAPILQTRE